MSVACLFETPAGPMLFGDMLLSHEAPNERIVLPTIGRVTDGMLPPGTLYTPGAVASKAVIISPKLAIAWVGPADQAVALVERLVAMTDAGSEFPDLYALIDAARHDSNGTLTVLGCYLAERPHFFTAGDAEEIVRYQRVLPGFGRCCLAGEGKELLLDQVEIL